MNKLKKIENGTPLKGIGEQSGWYGVAVIDSRSDGEVDRLKFMNVRIKHFFHSELHESIKYRQNQWPIVGQMYSFLNPDGSHCFIVDSEQVEGDVNFLNRWK